MSLENPLRGTPRIHGELLKLGHEVCETTIAKYMVRRPGSPNQTWHTFICNHMAEIVAIDFFTVRPLPFGRSMYSWSFLSTGDVSSTSTLQEIPLPTGRASN
jgi:hypothetical protein